MNRWSLLLMTLLGAALGMILLRPWQPSQSSANGRALAVSAADVASAPILGVSSAADVSTSWVNTEVASSSALPPTVPTSATKELDEWWARAEAGEARAWHALERIYRRCLSFRGEPRITPRVTAMPGTPESLVQASVIDFGKQYCADARLGRALEFLRRYDDQLPALARRGDDLARIRLLAANRSELPEQDQAALAQRIFEHGHDPVAVEEALKFLIATPTSTAPLSRLGVALWSNATLFVDESARVRELGAMWLGCELGAPCEAWGPWQQAWCLEQMNCAPQLDLRAFIQQRLLSADQFEKMQRYVALLRAQRQAVASS